MWHVDCWVESTLTWLEYKIARLTVAPTFLVLFDFSTFFALLYFPPLFNATSRSRDRFVNLFLFLFARLAVCTFVPLCQMSFDPCLFFAHLKFKALTKLVLSKYASESKPQDIEIHTERSKNCRQGDPLIAQRREEKGVENFVFNLFVSTAH